ncbi:MAG: hypothetical protein GXP14_12955 [Gammaproteobacteria bacterium]|nr:hypothetical protein [Gammaproteobacteria bacterium]
MNETIKKKNYWGWVTALLIAVVIAFAINKLPRGFSEDLSVVGQGSPVVVIVHNKEDMRSQYLMTMVDEVRGDYSDRIKFRIADTSVRLGTVFSVEQQVSGATLVLFGASGQRIAALNDVDNTAMLTTELDKAFDF